MIRKATGTLFPPDQEGEGSLDVKGSRFAQPMAIQFPVTRGMAVVPKWERGVRKMLEGNDHPGPLPLFAPPIHEGGR